MGCLGLNLVRIHVHRVHQQYKHLGLKSKLIELDNGSTIHCWVPDGGKHQGKPSLMLVHGFGADGCIGWENQVSDLAQDFALYVPDLLFFGKSTTTSSQRSEIFQAECMIKLLRNEGVDKVLVVGTSYGGFVAFFMAQLDAQLVKKVVIASSGVCMVASTNDGILKEFNATHIHEVLLPTSVKIQKQSMLRCSYRPQYLPDCIVRDMMEEFGQNRERKLELLDGLVIGTASAQPLPTLTQEVLILWGSHDRIFALDLGNQLHRHLGTNSKLVIIPKTGHIPQVEKPKVFNNHVRSFFFNSTNKSE